MASPPDRRVHSVLAVANQFLRLANERGPRLTTMHLQKLCYFAQGFNLAYAGAPLTYDRVEAWDFGPVFPVLYDAIKKYGSGLIDGFIRERYWERAEKDQGDIVDDFFDSEQHQLIKDVFLTYAGFEPFKLSALTHKEGSPWSKIYQPEQRGRVIPDALIRDYFRELAAA